MRIWWNWQTRTFEGGVAYSRAGSSPVIRTNDKQCDNVHHPKCFFGTLIVFFNSSFHQNTSTTFVLLVIVGTPIVSLWNSERVHLPRAHRNSRFTQGLRQAVRYRILTPTFASSILAAPAKNKQRRFRYAFENKERKMGYR